MNELIDNAIGGEEGIVYVVHCIDAEGPLYEDLEAKFNRLEGIFGITGVEPTSESFQKLLGGELDLGGKEDLVLQVFSSHLSNYMDTWDRLDRMLASAMSPKFRSKFKDSYNGQYVYSWFCVDHVGYELNPRRRTIGFHSIFDYYKQLLNSEDNSQDGLHWHFHPMSTYKEAHRCATSLLNSPHVVETLVRRIIERGWFPSCCRAGFQSERPDIHWFLEQYIPFDFTNTSLEDSLDIESQDDLANGRFGDWRLAPTDWGVYHPSHDYYQVPGNCRRWISRALNILNRFGNINAEEVDKAFQQAEKGNPALLAVASHDYRDLVPEVEHFRDLLSESSLAHPNVKFKYCDALEAFKLMTRPHDDCVRTELKLDVELHYNDLGKPAFLSVDTLQGEVFGPQPFLALKTRSQRFIHDNLDFSTDLKSWRYVFDGETISPDDLSAVGVGANDAYGNTVVEVIEV